jgi:hypothetical protein
VIPNTVKSIEKNTFRNCESLQSVPIPDSVEIIGQNAFSGCRSLRFIHIPACVKNVGRDDGVSELFGVVKYEHVFTGCESLTIICAKDSPAHEYAMHENIAVQFTGDAPPAAVAARTVQAKKQIPTCTETTYAYICCAEEDVPAVYDIVKPLYDQGYNVLYESEADIAEKTIAASALFLAFISDVFFQSPRMVFALEQADKHLQGKICPVYMRNCSLPGEWQSRIGMIHGLIRSEHTSEDFATLLQDALLAARCHCGKVRDTIYELKDFQYTVEDGEVVITKFTGAGMEAEIPKTHPYLKIPVTGIGNYAFRDGFLQSIHIPDSVSKIGDGAFLKCEPLQTVCIPDRVTEICDFLFTSCMELRSVNIPNAVTRIGKSAFMGCVSLSSIQIPDSVLRIGSYAFAGCSSLKSIDIPNRVTVIEEHAFQNCPKLTIHCSRSSYAEKYAKEHRIRIRYK